MKKRIWFADDPEPRAAKGARKPGRVVSRAPPLGGLCKIPSLYKCSMRRILQSFAHSVLSALDEDRSSFDLPDALRALEMLCAIDEPVSLATANILSQASQATAKNAIRRALYQHNPVSPRPPFMEAIIGPALPSARASGDRPALIALLRAGARHMPRGAADRLHAELVVVVFFYMRGRVPSLTDGLPSAHALLERHVSESNLEKDRMLFDALKEHAPSPEDPGVTAFLDALVEMNNEPHETAIGPRAHEAEEMRALYTEIFAWNGRTLKDE